MTAGDQGTGPKSGTRKGDAQRAARLKTALRENLKRRKAQARARTRPESAWPAHDSAGFVPDKPKG